MATAAAGTQMIVPCEADATWIEIRLVDEAGSPIAGARYCIRLPDFSMMEGVLDTNGTVRFEPIVPGDAEVRFPEFDGREWGSIQEPVT